MTRLLRYSRFALLTSLFWAGAQAASVGISPVTMEINPLRQLTAVTTLSNQGTEPVEFTAQLLRWSQKDGKEVNEPTRDALVNPPRFTILPGRSQVVRIGLRVRPSSPEVTYRLLLTQTPRAPKPSATSETTQATITPTYVFSLPLFVERPGGQAKLSTRLERGPDGNLNLVWANSGTRYEVYRNLSATVGDKTLNLGGLYVLSGSTMRLNLLALTYPAGSKLTLRYTNSEQQEQNETLDLPNP